MIEDKTVAVEQLAEVSSGQLADIVRDGRVLRMPCTSCVPNIEGACLGVHSNVSCGPAHWHRDGDAKGPARCSTVQVDDALGRMQVKHETYATGPRDMITMLGHASELDHEAPPPTHRSEIRFCPITFIVCTTVFLRHVHHRGRVWPDSWDACVVDDISQHNLILTLLGLISFIFPVGRFVSAVRSTMHGAANMNVTGILLFTFVSPGRYIEYLAKGNTSSLMKEDIVKGNRVEERIDTELVQRGDKLKGAGEMDEAMVTGESKPVSSPKALLSQAGGALCVRRRVAVGVWVALLTSGAADKLELTRLWHTSALSLATDFKTVSGRGISATVDSKHIVIGMPIVLWACTSWYWQSNAISGKSRQTMHEDEETRGCTVVVCSADGNLLPGLCEVSLTRTSPKGEEAVRLLCQHGLRLVMLTRATTRALRGPSGADVGVDTVLAGACRRWRRKDDVVAIVGDNINIESAHVVLMIKDDLLAGGGGHGDACAAVASWSNSADVTRLCGCSHPLVVASGHITSDANDECTRFATSPASTSRRSNPLQQPPLRHLLLCAFGIILARAMASSAPSACLRAEISTCFCQKAGSFGGVQPDLLLVTPPCSRALVLAAGYDGAKCLGPGRPLPCGLEVPVWWPAQSIRGNSGGVHQHLDGERVLTAHTLEQWNMTSVAIVLWSMRGWQPITQHHAGQCKLRVSHLDTRRQARAPVWPSFAVPAAYCVLSFNMGNTTAVAIHPASLELPITSRSIDCGSVAELQRALCMFPATVSTAVEDAEADTPPTSTSVSWLDCSTEQFIVDKVCEFARAFFNPSDDKPWQGSPGHCASPLTHTLVADVILLVCTFTSELELATSTADKQYNHQQRA
ncbi:hypothetical protein PTSG_11145 [Salpingoeca rosetta]|uniref:Uncharacterized protein n=1 Tax=Salpingoeca rosetta (strain ATCC 50818 / BSB-021) TaxID=946362 RepID=F2USJ8_SALR5|nr:uncharacterized protein PTSG_11145 [Salpingoeca rosetta]EGD81107.1 hypothetical protein PTSG_11145 [Salpingoeca rosetta]|eukprot:XP_004987792.1 hypothetical protein PTSG_11145 [Salpingoeca rosetta]